jgi:hypothetical protein
MTRKMFDVWLEGYRTTGEHAQASYLGRWSGRTFADACRAWAAEDPRERARFFDSDRLTFWGCRMFDNEKDARNTYG